MKDHPGQQDTPQDPDAYALAVPFVAAVSQGGPYDDAALAAGYDCGALSRELAVLALYGAQPARRPVKTELLRQLDLIAMDAGYLMAAHPHEPGDDPTWTWVSFTRVSQCSHEQSVDPGT